MHPDVQDHAREFLTKFEGYLRQMYLDRRGLVTTGIGDLIDDHTSNNPMALVHQFRWVKIGPEDTDGDPAEDWEVEEEWNRVKAKQEWKLIGGGNFVKRAREAGIITLQIPIDEVDIKFMSKLSSFEQTMKATPGGYFQDYETFPADAQLGILSLIWATGPGRLHIDWPKFSGLCQNRQWLEIAERKEFRWSNIDPKREEAMILLFENAGNLEDAVAQGFDFDITMLSYPEIVLPVQNA
jgi:hypothetical protein